MSIDENEMKNMLDGIIALADKERDESKSYTDLFKGSPDIESLLRGTESAMVDAVLNATRVLKTKLGYERVNDDAFYLLLALPFLENQLEKHIEKTQGSACCVDKAYYHLAKELKERLENK